MRAAIALIACAFALAGTAAAQTRTPVNVCGTLTVYQPTAATSSGHITVAGEQFSISTDAGQNISPDAKVGTDVCLTGAWVMSQTSGRNLIEVTVVLRSPRTSAPGTPTPTPCPSPGPPVPEIRHSSGLLIIGPAPECVLPVYEPLAKANSDARQLAESKPHDFGHPWDDRTKRELVLPIVNSSGERVARAWIQGGVSLAIGVKTAHLSRPDVPVRLPNARRSLAELERIMHDAIEIARSGLPGADAIASTHVDAEKERVILTVRRLTDEVAAVVVAKFGPDAVAVRVDPTFGPFVPLGGKTSELGIPALVLAAAAVVATGVALALFRRSRSRRLGGKPL